MAYNLTKKVPYSFEESMNKTKAALANEGFGVISEIDLKEKFKEKLDVDFREYRILGACNPKLAYQAIEKESNIGVLLPCNVLVQQHDDGQVEISAVNPMETMSGVDNPALTSLAQEVTQKLQKAFDLV
ncbi:MAG: DUF302 domain-containing protein [Daejeonella sp.]|uniref:DUF302 domain-containing protein n=1 Tax=Daejeonella sp. TaxID=2805397 RepID=UPI003C75C66E